jgi:hypothetical protein
MHPLKTEAVYFLVLLHLVLCSIYIIACEIIACEPTIPGLSKLLLSISANQVITGWLDLDFDRFHWPLNLCSWDLQLIQVWSPRLLVNY